MERDRKKEEEIEREWYREKGREREGWVSHESPQKERKQSKETKQSLFSSKELL